MKTEIEIEGFMTGTQIPEYVSGSMGTISLKIMAPVNGYKEYMVMITLGQESVVLNVKELSQAVKLLCATLVE